MVIGYRSYVFINSSIPMHYDPPFSCFTFDMEWILSLEIMAISNNLSNPCYYKHINLEFRTWSLGWQRLRILLIRAKNVGKHSCWHRTEMHPPAVIISPWCLFDELKIILLRLLYCLHSIIQLLHQPTTIVLVLSKHALVLTE